MLRGEALAAMRGDRKLFTDLDFDLHAGELLYIAGPNGSGKTTLLRMICGLVIPSAGQVLWKDENIHTLGEEFRADLLYCGHLGALKDDLSGLENLRFSCRLGGTPVSEDEAVMALSRMGLAGREDLPAKVLSQGQKRRVGLARLLLMRARLWVLDEPFTALDVGAIELLRETMRTHLAGGGLLVLTTHQQVEIEAAAVKRIEMGP
ncbi:MAG: cytochrome c biogenesis heme-transporting ATPase CcmA [Chromatiales bacterium]|jgi:heme exporter protein A|nr:cytochrome c biogenesis heme-transporting ATPase CcmA [Chromatiales bacterium]